MNFIYIVLLQTLQSEVAALHSQTGTSQSGARDLTSATSATSVDDMHGHIAQLEATRTANENELMSVSASKEQLQTQVAELNERAGKRAKKRETEFIRDQTQLRYVFICNCMLW